MIRASVLTKQGWRSVCSWETQFAAVLGLACPAIDDLVGCRASGSRSAATHQNFMGKYRYSSTSALIIVEDQGPGEQPPTPDEPSIPCTA
jgi:hypothetical protein